MEALNSLKQYLINMAHFQLKREELASNNTNTNGQAVDEKQRSIQDYDRNISILRQKYNELSKRVSVMFDKLNHLPFLRRARAVRWQLNMSTSTYGLLVSFLNSRDESLLSMSTLLQTKCELHVERRDPLPFTPACVLDHRTSSKEKKTLELNQGDIHWAAPAARRETESKDERLPFPKYHLEAEYDDSRQAAEDKRSVVFNRALLVNGFRRLEALERKREYETMPPAMQKMAKEGYHQNASSNATAIDPLKPTILLSTLCASTPGPILRPAPTAGTRSAFTDAATIWEEAGIGLCCAKVCPPDGRRVAVGCDDAAIRIWNLKDDKGSEPSEVLLGHKNGFPVFDVAWNRDGRSLLSAGGDGSIRLWDTMAVGPFGEVTIPKPSSTSIKKHSDSSKKAKSMFAETATSGSDMNVAGLRPENAPHSSGAALAVYRGHASSSPVWAVSFAPSGYYFASAGGDATARLWTTDRAVPVRLFTGHSASNVNCVEWHPNCNYIVTGSDDKTVRLWDIQTGQTVRLLNGCSAGINHVKVSPGGRYAAGSDYSGVVHLWDLGNGKKITEFRTLSAVQDNNQVGMGMVHSLAFSTCGTALAAGGDDGTVRIWDVRQDSLLDKPVVKAPAKSFPTRGTIIMDLSYTKRNLLLAMGKIATPVPSMTHGTD
jgi:WD40 repeat protein